MIVSTVCMNSIVKNSQFVHNGCKYSTIAGTLPMNTEVFNNILFLYVKHKIYKCKSLSKYLSKLLTFQQKLNLKHIKVLNLWLEHCNI